MATSSASRTRPLILWTLVVVFLGAIAWFYLPHRPRLVLPQGEPLMITPDGAVVAVWTATSELAFYRMDTGEELGRITEVRDKAWVRQTLRVSADGRWFVGATTRGEVKLWSVPDGAVKFSDANQPLDPQWTKAPPSPVISPDGRYLAYRAPLVKLQWKLKVRDLETGKDVDNLFSNVSSGSRFEFSPNGKFLLVTTHSLTDEVTTRAELVDSASGEATALISKTNLRIYQAVFSSDGKYLALDTAPSAQKETAPHSVHVWNLHNGRQIGKWDVAFLSGLRFTGDSSRLIARFREHAPPTAPGPPEDRFLFIDPTKPDDPGHIENVPRHEHLFHTPDGLVLALVPGMYDGPPAFFDMPDLRPRSRLEPYADGAQYHGRGLTPEGRFFGVVVTPPKVDGRRDADYESPWERRKVRLRFIDTTTGRETASMPIVQGSPVLFTPDGRTLVTMDPEARPHIWEFPVGRPWGLLGPIWGGLGLVYLLGATIVLRRGRRG